MKSRRGTYCITIEQTWCKGCYICLEICPKKVFALTGEVARRGFQRVEARAAGLCTGCLLCEVMCPDVAIRIESLDGDAGHEESQADP